MNNRFPLLVTIAVLLKIAGALALIGAVIGIGYGIVEPQQPGHVFGSDDILAISFGALLLLFGLLTVAASEVIGVLLAIEKNTRWAAATATPT
jgi:hypothetical protein